MNKSVILFVALCGGIACAIVYLDKNKSIPPAPAPVAAAPAAPADAAAPAEKVLAPKPASMVAAPLTATEAAPITTAAPAVAEVKSEDAASPIHKAVDALLSAKSAAEKHELFQQLVKSGQIDQAIAELQQRTQDNPANAAIPTTLGEAQLNKVKAMHDSGKADYSEMGILAMQADQSFNTALKIDPQNWEAQFVKASSMYYWPLNPQTDDAVVQNLSKLVDQQDTMTAQPQFAQTYVVLGNEYQKIGQSDKALATYQLGLSKFPGDPTLQKKVNGQ